MCKVQTISALPILVKNRYDRSVKKGDANEKIVVNLDSSIIIPDFQIA